MLTNSVQFVTNTKNVHGIQHTNIEIYIPMENYNINTNLYHIIILLYKI